jgi:hypothetical protein
MYIIPASGYSQIQLRLPAKEICKERLCYQ